MIILENDVLKAEISLHGAELRSAVRKDKDASYLWYADSKFWGRTSPVLFPFVGGVKDKVYRTEGKAYAMGQHGFARDMDFVLTEQTADEAWFALDSTDETLKKYPYRFRLEIGYRLNGGSIRVMWRVKNTDSKEMYFSIGAHPAFMCPMKEDEEQSTYQVSFYDADGKKLETVVSTSIGSKGLVVDEKVTYELNDGCLYVTEHLFDHDALVLEHNQVQQIGLKDADGNEYIRVKFDTPLVGVWSPPGKKAPFVCIEPWYGRCDAENFAGELKDREWSNTLEAGKLFEAEYEIITF